MLKELKFLFNRLPFYVIFYPTSRCNARCPHCYNYTRQDNAALSDELNIDEINRISKNMGHVKVLTISGGEPFLRDDLSEIIAIFYKNNGLQYVSFHTNAFLSDKVVSTTEKVLRTLKGINVIVCISIDCIGEEHDRFRGVTNGFSRILETIEGLKALKNNYKNLTLVTSTIYSHSTINSFEDTIKYIQDNIKGVKPSLSFVRGDTKDSEEKSVDYIKYQQFCKNFVYTPGKNTPIFSPIAFKDAIEALTARVVVANYKNKKQTIRCQAGKKLVVIYENGDVYPCETLKDKFGNLRDVNYDIGQLLFSEKGNKMLRDMQQQNFCHCTWENVIPINLLFSPRHYLDILFAWAKLFLLRRK